MDWILTASPENHAATAERGFSIIGMKERRRNQALEIAVDDPLFLYLTKVQAFAGAVRVTGELFEAFQGQLRTISGRDAGVLLETMS